MSFEFALCFKENQQTIMNKITPGFIIVKLILNFCKCYGNDEDFRPVLIGGYPTCLTDPEATFCDLDRAYPEENIDASLVQSSYYYDPTKFIEEKIATENRSLFADVAVDKDGNLVYFTRIENKIQSTCAYNDYLVIPPVAKSTVTKSWVYTVNNSKYRQEYKGQKCDTRELPPCQENVPTSYEAKCIQRFEEIALLAINPTNQQPKEDKFSLPSHCECEVTSSIFFRDRNATTDTTETQL